MSYYVDIALELEKRVIETKHKYDGLIQNNCYEEAEQYAIDNEDFYQRWLKQVTKEAETMRYLKANMETAIECMREYRIKST